MNVPEALDLPPSRDAKPLTKKPSSAGQLLDTCQIVISLLNWGNMMVFKVDLDGRSPRSAYWKWRVNGFDTMTILLLQTQSLSIKYSTPSGVERLEGRENQPVPSSMSTSHHR